MKIRNVFLIIFAMILLAGCSRAETAIEPSFDAERPLMGGAPEIAPMPQGTMTPEESKNMVSSERMVVRTAQMRVSVADPATAVVEVSRLAESFGGYVVASSVYESSRTETEIYQGSNITIRVPSERLDEAMGRIRALAADPESGVLNESISGQDVTSEYVDLESRLRNLEAAERQLQELLDNAPDLQYTMDVFRELTSVREQIEVIKGRMQYLEESTNLSAITVDFVAEASLKPIEIGGWKPEGTARAAIQALINSAQTVADGLIWFGIYCLPFLIPLAIVLYLILKTVNRRRAERLARKTIEASAVEPPKTPTE